MKRTRLKALSCVFAVMVIVSLAGLLTACPVENPPRLFEIRCLSNDDDSAVIPGLKFIFYEGPAGWSVIKSDLLGVSEGNYRLV
ncbi:MAG: hypothetical protein LBT11_05950, partial [Treponema sp.]|nr:hypothetical protein [Treponema sp.]